MLAAVTRAVHSPSSSKKSTGPTYHDPFQNEGDQGKGDDNTSFIVSEPASSATADTKPGSTQGNILSMVPNKNDKNGSYTLEKPATSATSQTGPSSTTAPADNDKDKKKKGKEKNEPIIVNLNQYDRKTFRFEFDPSSTAEQMDQVIRAAVLLSSDTPYELKKPDGTYVGINDLRASKNDTYNITYDRTTLRLVNNLPHKVFLLEPRKTFSRIKNAFGRFHLNPAIFSPLSCKEVEDGRCPAAMINVQTPIAIQLKQIDNYGHIYYIIEITAIPMFGLVSSRGPSIDSDTCGWYMGKFTLQFKDIRADEECNLPKLFIYEYAPTNEIGEVSVTSSTGWNAEAGPTLTPAPPFASLSATVGYHEDRSSTTQLKNLNCTYEHRPSPIGVPTTSWQIELSYFLRHVRKMDKLKTPKMENFHWGNSTSRSIGNVPQEARRLLKKKFMQSYIFEENPEYVGSSYTFEFEITAAVYAFYSACPGYGRNVLFMYEDGSTHLNHPDKPADRIAAVQRTRVRVDLVPSKMNITVSKVPIHTPRELWRHLVNVTMTAMAAESAATGEKNVQDVQNAGRKLSEDIREGLQAHRASVQLEGEQKTDAQRSKDEPQHNAQQNERGGAQQNERGNAQQNPRAEQNERAQGVNATGEQQTGAHQTVEEQQFLAHQNVGTQQNERGDRVQLTVEEQQFQAYQAAGDQRTGAQQNERDSAHKDERDSAQKDERGSAQKGERGTTQQDERGSARRDERSSAQRDERGSAQQNERAQVTGVQSNGQVRGLGAQQNAAEQTICIQQKDLGQNFRDINAVEQNATGGGGN